MGFATQLAKRLDFAHFGPVLRLQTLQATPHQPYPMEFRDYAAKETAALFSRLLASQAEASVQHLRSLRDALDAASRGIEESASGPPGSDEDVQELIRRLNTAAGTAAKVAAQKVQKEAQAALDLRLAEPPPEKRLAALPRNRVEDETSGRGAEGGRGAVEHPALGVLNRERDDEGVTDVGEREERRIEERDDRESWCAKPLGQGQNPRRDLLKEF